MCTAVEKACGNRHNMGNDFFKHPIAVRDFLANPAYKDLGLLKQSAVELTSVLKSLRKKSNCMLLPFEVFQRLKTDLNLAHDTVVLTWLLVKIRDTVLPAENLTVRIERLKMLKEQVPTFKDPNLCGAQHNLNRTEALGRIL